MNSFKLNHIEQTYLPSSTRHVKRFKKSREEFIKMLDSEGYVLVSQYTGVDSHVSVICPKGHEWNTCCFTNFRKGVRCRTCDGQCPEVTKKVFYDGLKSEGYTLLTEYVNTLTNVSVICNNGHLWDTCNPSRFNQGVRCRICDGQDKDQAKERFDKLLNVRGDRRLSEYESANKSVLIQYGKCGHIADTVSPNRYRHRKHCPICSHQSKESYLATYTKETSKSLFHNAEFEYRKLKNPETNYFLPFDIYLPTVNTLIEIHGHQHYEYNTLFHKDKEDFLYRQELDRYKKDWALSNGYNFVEIDIREQDEKSVEILLSKLKKMEDLTYGN